ncbi:lysophospholipid acyltransferase family protein [Sessilibacter corallicola]|uniref:1-acyl-sn-glycerol-3-phosphate acyltransferase n=1 Tax=Sessilibacter corallicola TaxID=2904075 RepID=A0ABQ0ABC4_9GAMM|nr:lysophospholipid acyltransferase family protein [Sessilibacter corallicola]MCE2028058.1 1-acyl-sn-glycerol-3-phosphate acyltransferase [Sessilibacter corallicola]
MINFLRAVLFHIVYALSAFVFGTFSVTLYYVFPKSRAQIIINRWNFFVVFAAKTICGIKYQIDGELPDNTKRYVVMAKHQSAWETFFLQTLFEPASTILKHELLKIPFFGWGLGRLDPVAIDRANPIQALKQVKQLGTQCVASGRNLIVFPEGTRVEPKTAGKYARSGAEIALATNAEIIPVAHNAGSYWINKEFSKIPGTVSVIIGEPISTEGKTSREVTEEVRAWIEAQQERIES